MNDEIEKIIETACFNCTYKIVKNTMRSMCKNCNIDDYKNKYLQEKDNDTTTNNTADML